MNSRHISIFDKLAKQTFYSDFLEIIKHSLQNLIQNEMFARQIDLTIQIENNTFTNK